MLGHSIMKILKSSSFYVRNVDVIVCPLAEGSPLFTLPSQCAFEMRKISKISFAAQCNTICETECASFFKQIENVN